MKEYEVPCSTNSLEMILYTIFWYNLCPTYKENSACHHLYYASADRLVPGCPSPLHQGAVDRRPFYYLDTRQHLHYTVTQENLAGLRMQCVLIWLMIIQQISAMQHFFHHSVVKAKSLRDRNVQIDLAWKLNAPSLPWVIAHWTPNGQVSSNHLLN